MNTPTPTPRTDAATYPADCLGKTLVTNRDCSRALETELVTLTGAYTCTHHNDAERTACPVCLVTALTAERDELRDDRANEIAWAKWASHHLADAIAVKAERDQLRAKAERFQRLQRFVDTAAAEMKVGLITFGGIAELRAECDELRSEVERLRSDRDCEKRLRKDADELRENAIARAERYRLASLKLDAELAAERARLDWVFRNCKVEADDYTTGNRDVYAIHDREDLRTAMKENAT
jgi:hypothetical protein